MMKKISKLNNSVNREDIGGFIKPKAIRWNSILLLSFILSFMLISNGLAIESTSHMVLDEKTVNISAPGANPGEGVGGNPAMIPVEMEPNSPGDIYIDPSVPEDLSIRAMLDPDNDGAYEVVQSFTNDSDEQWVGNFDFWSNGPIIDNQDKIGWIRILNDSNFPQGAVNTSLTIRSEINVLGDIGVGQVYDFDMPQCQDSWNELDSGLKPGAYMLISYKGPLSGLRIISPEGYSIGYTSSSQQYSFYAAAMKVYWYFFTVNEEGVYRFYFTLSDNTARALSLKLTSLKITGCVENENIEVKESDVPMITSADESISPDDVSYYLYRIDGQFGKVLHLDFNSYRGYSKAVLFTYTPGFGYTATIISLMSMGYTESYTLSMSDKPVYLLIYNPKTWDFATYGTTIKKYMWYAFRYEIYNAEEAVLGNVDSVSLAPGETKFYLLNTSETVAFMANYTFNTPSITMWLSQYDISMRFYRTINPLFNCPPGSGYEFYLLRPGSYIMRFINTDRENSGNVEISTRFLNISDNPIDNIPSAFDSEIFISDLSQISFTHMYTDDGGQFLPVIFPINYSASNMGLFLNLTWVRSDNAFVGDNRTNFGVQVAFIMNSNWNDSFVLTNSMITDIAPGNVEGVRFFTGDISGTNDTFQLVNIFKEINFTGWIAIQPYDLEVENGTSWYRYNGTLNLRVATTTVADFVKDYSITEDKFSQGYLVNALTSADFLRSPYNQSSYYPTHIQVNLTRYPMVRVMVLPNRTDIPVWYDLIIKTNNTASVDVDVYRTDIRYITGTENSLMDTFTGTSPNANFSTSLGTYGNVLIVIQGSTANTSFLSDIYINVIAEPVRSLKVVKVSGIAAVGGEINMLALGLGLGIGGGVVLIGAIYYWKKRR